MPRTAPIRRAAAVVAIGLVTLLAACSAPTGAGPTDVRVAIDGGDRVLPVGATTTLSATVAPGDARDAGVTWSSDAPDVASVDVDGVLRAHEVGDATVRATSVAAPGAHDEVRVTVDDADGVLLDGEPDDPAAGATRDVSVPMSEEADDVSLVTNVAGHEIRILRTEIELHLARDATVGDVNALLERVDARIVDMLEGHLALTVRIPDPGDLEALNALVDDLEDDPLVRYVLTGVAVEPDGAPLAPAALPPSAATVSDVEHHLAVRGHAAWNLRPLLPTHGSRPRLIVADLFGDGPVDDAFDVVITEGDFSDRKADAHGYHVLGIVTGAWDPDPSVASDRARATGIYPRPLRTRVVDTKQWRVPTISRVSNGIVRHVDTLHASDPNAGIVVNTSLHHRYHPMRSRGARSWTEKVRDDDPTTVGAGRETWFVHATSAGNDEGHPASGNSAWTEAALEEMSTVFGTVYPNLTNVLVVENRVNTPHDTAQGTGPATSRPLPGCAWWDTSMGGDISGIGHWVYSLARYDSDGDPEPWTAGTMTGTSMAAPQVAGVAALVWALDPSLTGPQVAELLRATAHDDPTTTRTRSDTASGDAIDCHATAPAPVVDAYAAMLAAGGDAARRAVADVNGDGTFDAHDIDAILAAFDAASGDLDYGRFDLNGDGRVAPFDGAERFDLDGDGSFATAAVHVTTFDGTTGTRTVDETDVTDLDVLCALAYGPAYDGDEEARNARLGDRCLGRPTVEIVSPSEGAIRVGYQPVPFRAAMTATEPGGTLPSDDALYRVDWTYDLDDGTTVHLGTTEPGVQLTAYVVCPDPTVVATATHRNVPTAHQDRVRFTVDPVDPTKFPWRAEIVGPGGLGPSYLPVQDPDGVVLHADATRVRCAGVETAVASDLRWEIDGTSRTPTPRDALALFPSDLDTDDGYASATVAAWHTGAATASRTEHVVIPCTLLALDGPRPGGLRACPDPNASSLFQDALARYYGNVAEARWTMRQVEMEMGLLDPRFPPDPFPWPDDRLDFALPDAIGATRTGWGHARIHLDRIEETFERYDAGMLRAPLLDALLAIEVDATLALANEEPDTLRFVLDTSELATATALRFLPEAEGGAGAWDLFPTGARTEPRGVAAPALGAIAAYHTAIAYGHELGGVDDGVAEAVGVLGGIHGALDELEP